MASAVFAEIEKNIQADPSLVKSINGVYQFNVNTADGVKNWTVDLKTAPGGVKQGPAPKADCTLTLKEQDLVDMSTGKLNGQQAFMQGKLKIQGNMSFAMKLGQVVAGKKKPAAPAASKPAVSAAPAAGSSPSPAASSSSSSSSSSGSPAVSAVFDTLSKAITANPDLIKKINGVYQFNITPASGAAQQWSVDLKSAPGVKQGPAAKPDCTLVLKEQDFLDMMSGKLNGQQAFMQGKLKIQGNMSYAMKLNDLTKAMPKAKL
eukprot:TRINITY_DN13614_c0_g1_i2.p1 TRINITY_DN13614_c0_g1~~TRINITY_DN13614_c0_g1_i2.p1  ORF type:complete len:262 (-),score=121.89 TRINITY_DN13614_c0_g1_i2:94-879(-)